MTVLVGLVVTAVAALSPMIWGNGYLPWRPAPHETISGRISCQSGNFVTGVWVQEETNTGKFAELQHRNSYRSTIMKGAAYHLNIGCGGTPADWTTSLKYLGETRERTLLLECYDVRGTPGYGTCATVTAGSLAPGGR
ncbi:hypothetical protein [Streptomyces sp. NPDC055607]